jgi:hypothetical protein
MGRDITKCHPRLQTKAEELIALCKKNGITIKIGECYRTVEEQNELYAQGRTKPGNIVSNAKGTNYASQHQWGIAMDFFLDMDIDGDGKKSDDAFNNRKSTFEKVGKLAKSIGLGWGGDWTSPVDLPHVYLPDWGKTTGELKRKYGTPDKFKKTWIYIPEYEEGKLYTCQSERNVRKGPATWYKRLKHVDLRKNGQQNDIDKDGRLDKGTKVKCLEIKKWANGNIWIRIPSGWVCAVYKGKVYIK